MKISSGFSEININTLQSNKIRSEKLYVWPVYDQGKVEQIHAVTRRTESNIAYSKPVESDHMKLMGISRNTFESEYNSSGKVTQRSVLAAQPGTFFDAIA